MAIKWSKEACELGRDPHSGAEIIALTHTPLSNLNIYCEQPYATPDSKRIAFLRAPSSDPRVPPATLCVADLEKWQTAVLEPEITCYWVGTCGWSGKLYYTRANGELICVDLHTLEKQIILTHWDPPYPVTMDTVSPDQRYIVGVMQQPDYTSALVRIDTQTRQWETVYQSEDRLTHVQYNPVRGSDLLVQRNPGLRQDHLARRMPGTQAADGAVHFLLREDGTNERPLAVGEPISANTCGHSGWVGASERVGIVLRWPSMSARPEEVARGITHDPRHPQGNFITVGPGDAASRVFPAPQHLFIHVNVSRCGKYFVCDSVRHGIPGPVELVMGNIDTGKCATLVHDTGSTGGAPAITHLHAYLTADNRKVIYNSNRTGICHVHMATVPEDFLAGLE